jgi:hypothetical protein
MILSLSLISIDLDLDDDDGIGGVDIAGWQSPDCGVYIPRLQLTPDLTFEWTIDDTNTPVWIFLHPTILYQSYLMSCHVMVMIMVM